MDQSTYAGFWKSSRIHRYFYRRGISSPVPIFEMQKLENQGSSMADERSFVQIGGDPVW